MTHPFVFLVGANGSGTTLHRAILDSHPDLAIPGESHFIVDLASKRPVYEADHGFDVAALVSDLSVHRRFINWGIPAADLAEQLSDGPAIDTYPEAIRRVFQIYAEGEGKSRYGDKTQSYIHHIPLLADLFPEARFIHAIRDGRNVALAHAKGEKVEQVAASWKRRVLSGRRAGQALGPDRYLESRYEDLIENAERSVRRICEFAELEFHPQMLKYYERADSVIATTAAPDRHLDIYKPPTKGLQDWQRDLATSQVARFEAIAGRALDELGYERAVRNVPLSKRTSAWGHLAYDAFRLTGKRVAKRLGLRR